MPKITVEVEVVDDQELFILTAKNIEDSLNTWRGNDVVKVVKVKSPDEVVAAAMREGVKRRRKTTRRRETDIE